MSLSQVGEGLLQTHVTWSDIELDMQDALGTVATFGPNKKVTNIGEGNGFASRICLIDPDWQNGTTDLPKKFVVKIISQLTMVEAHSKMENPPPIDLEAFQTMGEKMRQIHNVEVQIYKLIVKYGRAKIPHTKIYKSHRFTEENTSKGYLIMEFIDDLALVHAIDNVEVEALDKVLKALAAFERITFEATDEEKAAVPGGFLAEIYKSHMFNEENTSKGYLIMEFIESLALVHAIDNVEPEALDKVLKALAAFERITLEMTDQEKSLHPTGFFSDLCAIIFTPKMLEATYSQLDTFFAGDMVEEMKKLRQYVPKIIEPEYLAKLDNLCGVIGMTPVLVHADLWSTNMLWTKKKGEHKVRAIIDYQTAHIGCAAADLARLFCSLLGGKARKENWQSLRDTFYRYVREEMGENTPYTLEQLEEAYHLIFPMAAFFVVFAIPSTLGYITEHRKNEERHNTMEIAMEKAKGLINDLIYEFERNEILEMN